MIFSNGNLKRISNKENFYENEWYDCGLWVEFNINEKLVKKEAFANCFDDSIACM